VKQKLKYSVKLRREVITEGWKAELVLECDVWCPCAASGTPRHRSGRGDTGSHASHVPSLPTHVCTMSPEAIRDEVETLKTDFNARVTQILFDSMLCAYYTGCVPLCFAQVMHVFTLCVSAVKLSPAQNSFLLKIRRFRFVGRKILLILLAFSFQGFPG